MSDKRDKLQGIHEGLDINTYVGKEIFCPLSWAPRDRNAIA